MRFDRGVRGRSRRIAPARAPVITPLTAPPESRRSEGAKTVERERGRQVADRRDVECADSWIVGDQEYSPPGRDD